MDIIYIILEKLEESNVSKIISQCFKLLKIICFKSGIYKNNLINIANAQNILAKSGKIELLVQKFKQLSEDFSAIKLFDIDEMIESDASCFNMKEFIMNNSNFLNIYKILLK